MWNVGLRLMEAASRDRRMCSMIRRDSEFLLRFDTLGMNCFELLGSLD